MFNCVHASEDLPGIFWGHRRSKIFLSGSSGRSCDVLVIPKLWTKPSAFGYIWLYGGSQPKRALNHIIYIFIIYIYIYHIYIYPDWFTEDCGVKTAYPRVTLRFAWFRDMAFPKTCAARSPPSRKHFHFFEPNALEERFQGSLSFSRGSSRFFCLMLFFANADDLLRWMTNMFSAGGGSGGCFRSLLIANKDDLWPVWISC